MTKHTHNTEGEERKKGPEKIFEVIIAENVPSTEKVIVNHVHEAQRVPSRINPKGNTLRHIVIKLTKIKDRVIRSNKGKMTREKRQLTYKGKPIRLSAYFSTENPQA